MNKELKLNNNKKMPILGFGTWQSNQGIVGKAVEDAIISGYRHVDCAKAYLNEKEIGDSISNLISNDKVKRNELFVTGKLWNADHDPRNVVKTCKESLLDLKLDYLDLYLMHWGLSFDPDPGADQLDKNGIIKLEQVSIQETWKAMELLVNDGLVKSIGVSNFTSPMIIDLLSYCKITPVINQIEIHPYNTQQELVGFCHKKDIQVTAYSPLGGTGNANKSPLMENVVGKIAKKYKKTPAQILIRWNIERGISVIPKTTNSKRIKENIDVFDFFLDKDEVERMNNLNKNYRFVDPINFWGIPYFN